MKAGLYGYREDALVEWAAAVPFNYDHPPRCAKAVGKRALAEGLKLGYEPVLTKGTLIYLMRKPTDPTAIGAEGVLRHRYHGEYMSGMVLQFNTVEEADLARYTLGSDDWKTSSERGRFLTWCGDGNAYKAQEARFLDWDLRIKCSRPHDCKDQCVFTRPAHLRHSLDISNRFTVRIPRPVFNQP